MAGMNFDATTVEPDKGFEPLPAGDYVVTAVKSEDRTTEKGGQMYSFELDIQDGEFKNRKLWANFNYVNANAVAQEIGQAQLSAFCHAVGVLKPGDTSELHGIPFVVTIDRKKNKNTGNIENNIKKYKPLASATPGGAAPAGPAPQQPQQPAQQQQQQQQQQQPQGVEAGTNPWA